MEKRTHNIAILGCGKVAHLHAQAIQELTNARIGAVWSRSAKTAEEFAAQYNTLAYSDITKMVQENNIDLVIVCTPHPFHKEPVLAAANAGANILVEKPLASSLEDSDAMIQVCKKNQVKLGVVSQRRWYEPAKRIKETIDAGKIGKPVFGTVNMLGWRDIDYYESDEWRGTWALDGGVITNQN